MVHEGFQHTPHPHMDFAVLLPSSLECLTLFYPDGKTLLWLRQLSRALDRLPKLRKLDLCYLPDKGHKASWFLKRCDAAFDVFRRAGVTVRIYDAGELTKPTGNDYTFDQIARSVFGNDPGPPHPYPSYEDFLGIRTLFGDEVEV